MTTRIRSGDETAVEALVHGGFGRTSRAQVACAHYLPANRFEWWGVSERGEVPRTGPIGFIGSASGAARELFDAEFCSPLATVIGADLHLVEPLGAGRAISWEALPDGASPNALPSIECSFRSVRPGSVPVVKDVEVLLGLGSRQRRKVAINGVEDGHELDPLQPRPSLFIDFFFPQRAVGLECGFLGADGREIDSRRVRLIARDSAGDVLVDSTGTDLFPAPWAANAIFYLIGVRHQGGAIRSIELRFGDPDQVVLEPQMIYRVWHEPLPPAAVTQRTAAVEFNPTVPAGDGNGIGVPPHDGPLGPITIRLPFACDRAVVMMRGFRMFFLDQHPHKVELMDAYISGPPRGDRSAGTFTTEPGGRITIVPYGNMTSGDGTGYRVLIYYLVLAWNSEQMEVFPVGGVQGDNPASRGLFSSQITLPDPCPPPRAECDFPGSVLGPLSGSLQGFSLLARPAQEVELLGLHMGLAGGEECREPAGGGAFVRVIPFTRPSLHRSASTIAWQFCTDFYDVSGSYRAAQGTVLVGRSVRAEAWRGSPNLTVESVGPRDPADPFLFPQAVFDHFAHPIDADMAFLSLGQFVFEPKGEIRELEVEVSGREYDGQLVTWNLGAGISVSPPVSSGGKRFAVGGPAFGGVVRRAASADTRLAVQHLRFDDAIRGALSLEPAQYGAVRNTGNVPILFTSAVRSGRQADEFNFLIQHDGDMFREDELLGRAPLVLYPGQTLVIGGRFFPQAETGPNDPARFAWVDLETNAPRYRVVRVEARGRTIPEDAHGVVLPAAVNFGFVSLNASNHPIGFPARNVLLISDGQTPLLVPSLALDDPDVGFQLGIRDPGGLQPAPVTPGVAYQVAPGDAMIIEVRFIPVRVGPAETRLVAVTNAGRFETRVLGDGVL